MGSPVEFECSTTRTTSDNDEVSFVAAVEWPPAGEIACFTATPPLGIDFDGLGDSGKTAGWPIVDCLEESGVFETTTGLPSMGEHVY